MAELDHHEDVQSQLLQSKQLQKLMMPHEMGELFKVIALTKALDIELLGFNRGDKRIRL